MCRKYYFLKFLLFFAGYITVNLNSKARSFRYCAVSACGRIPLEKRRVLYDIMMPVYHRGQTLSHEKCEKEYRFTEDQPVPGDCESACAAQLYLKRCGCWPRITSASKTPPGRALHFGPPRAGVTKKSVPLPPIGYGQLLSPRTKGEQWIIPLLGEDSSFGTSSEKTVPCPPNKSSRTME